jgi:outer membrane protein assembly factor BamB
MAYPFEGKPIRPEVTIAMPRYENGRLFLSEYYHGSQMLELAANPPWAKLGWNRHGKPMVDFAEGLHSLIATPVMAGGYIYGICGEGELRCLDAASGDRLWETNAVTGGKSASMATAFFTPQGDRVWIWNDQGELILSRLSSKGYTELGRAKLLETAQNTRGRETLWCHPAFANRCFFAQNGKELICVSLAAERG